MACSPVDLFRLMDRKLSPVGTKVRGWFPVKLKFFSGSFSAASVVHSTVLRRSSSLSHSWLFVPYRWTGFISFRSPFWLSRGLWFVDVIFVSLGKKITKMKKFKDLPTIVVKLNLTFVQFTYLFPFFCCCSVQIWRLYTTPFPPAENSLGLV